MKPKDLVGALDSGTPISALRVDGGVVKNELLNQFQADILGVPVQRPGITEVTALGAAYAAGLAAGLWESREELCEKCKVRRELTPRMPEPERGRLYGSWLKAVERSFNWL
jgi:glycerol kinase